MDRYEVLAPVGNFQELNVILDEKPDAVYVGMKGLSSRPSRTDFTIDEIKQAVKNCHERQIRLYVAVNSNVKNSDFDHLVDSILELDQWGVDSFILADYGLIYTLSGKLQHAQMHASTLLGAYNLETIQVLKNLGVQRIIFYANLYLDEMIPIINAFPELDYELVAEGGTCFNDIRQCRLPHIVDEIQHKLTCRCGCVLYQDGEPRKGKMLAEHPCRVAEVVGIYMAAGIQSFKIEGRTVPASERVQIIRDLKAKIQEFEQAMPLNSYLHYIARLRREVY